MNDATEIIPFRTYTKFPEKLAFLMICKCTCAREQKKVSFTKYFTYSLNG